MRFKLILQNQIVLKDRTHPISIRLTDGKQRAYIRTGYSCKESNWDTTNSLIKSNNGQVQRINKSLKRIEIKADDIIYQALEQGHDLTITEFKLRYNGREVKRVSVKEFLRMHIQRLKESNKYGNARVFKILNGSITNYTNKELNWIDIDKKFLRGFIACLEQKGCKGNTIWLYLRTLRALYNKAIEEGYARFENYPFRNRLNPHGAASAILPSTHLRSGKRYTGSITVRRAGRQDRRSCCPNPTTLAGDRLAMRSFAAVSKTQTPGNDPLDA